MASTKVVPLRAPALQTQDLAATRDRILWAAHTEFADKGLKGTRIDAIAKRANCNKALIYHYFSGKDDLFREVLEITYADIRNAERQLNLDGQPPLEAMRKLVGFSFDYVSHNPEFISIINDANMHDAVHLALSDRTRDMNSPLVALIGTILARGEHIGEIRSGVDPVQLYISIASICYFYVANRATLSAIFALDNSATGLAVRRLHVCDVILGYLRPENLTKNYSGDLP